MAYPFEDQELDLSGVRQKKDLLATEPTIPQGEAEKPAGAPPDFPSALLPKPKSDLAPLPELKQPEANLLAPEPPAISKPTPGDVGPEAPGIPLPEMNAADTKKANDALALYKKSLADAEPAPDRSLGGEVGASLGRGLVGLAQLPVQVAKIVGADVLNSKTVQNLMEPILTEMESWKQSSTLRPGKAAGGPAIELDRILQDPGGVAQQIAQNASNAYFWASQVPEQIGPWALMAGTG
jgi:hypothetical protein